MPVSNDFDRFFLQLPPFDRENNFQKFWTDSINELKQIPIEPRYEKNKKKSNAQFEFFDVSFKGYMKSTVNGELYYPNGLTKSKVIILIHDYNKNLTYNKNYLMSGHAYFFLRLRGHELLDDIPPEETKTPGYIVDNILDKDNYYVKGILLDALRVIDVVRLNRRIDCSKIGIIGKGLGAALAIFTAAFSDRVKAVVLDTPSFCHLPLYQNLSSSDATNEINSFIANHRNKKNQIKKNLTYFDAINFADMVKCDILTIVGFKDTTSPPECVFALFNHLLTDKTIEVYPDDGNSAGGDEQFKKSLKWIVKTLQ
jgi:cephalosporin-C deacetylase